MRSEATLHMLCGKIASGKSTLAAQLARAPDTVLLSEDQLLASLYPGEIHTLDDYVRCVGRLRHAIGPHVQSLLGLGISVVLDFQANTRPAREWMRGLFEGAGARHELHMIAASDETCRERLHARNAAGAHEYRVSPEQFDAFTRHFVTPGADEGFNIVPAGAAGNDRGTPTG